MNTPAAQALFDGSMTPGVYKLIAPIAEIVAALQRAGWDPGVLRNGDTEEEFLANVGTALHFPSYYGKNLDALWDCLTDLVQPTVLVWTSWQELAIDHPREWARVMTIIEDRTRLKPAFALVLV